MKTIFRLTVTAAAFALSCQASEIASQITQANIMQSYTHSNGVTYVARMYDGSPKKIAFTKTTADSSEQIDCGYATFEISYLKATIGMLKPVPKFQEINFRAENEAELILLTDLATRFIKANACYFKPPYLANPSANERAIVHW